MTSSHDKLETIRQALNLYNIINRKQLKAIIMKAINISDAHAVNSWIDKLVVFEVITPKCLSVAETLGMSNRLLRQQWFKVNRSITEQQTENPKALSSELNVTSSKELVRRSSLELIGEGSEPRSKESEESVPSLQ